MGGDYSNTTLCQGHDKYQEDCTHNGPSAAVWRELIIAACIIFGLLFCYVKCTSRRQLIIEWNDNDEDSTDIGSSYDNVEAPTKRRQRPYYHMHPALSRSQKSLQAAKQWVSDRISQQSLPSTKVQPQLVQPQQQLKRDEPKSRQSSEVSFYTAPTPSQAESHEELQQQSMQTAFLATPTPPEKEADTEIMV